MGKIIMTKKTNLTIEDAFDQFVKKCRIKNLSDKTILDYETKIVRLYKFVDKTEPVSSITEDTIDDFILSLRDEGVKDITINSYLRSIRAFLYYCMDYDNLLLRRLDAMLTREGHTARNVITGVEDTILFRRSNATGGQEQITLYYHNDNFISKGDIISYNSANYLIINKNHWESNSHFKSNGIKCNHVWYLPNTTIPVLVEELQQPQPYVGTVLSTVDGYLQVRTSDIEYFHTDFIINTKVNICGGAYYLVNKFFLDGICYLYFVRETAITSLTPEIICDTDAYYSAGQTVTLHPYMILTDTDTTVYIPDATFNFESNDEEIAVCEGNEINLLADGTPIITITGTATFETGGSNYTDISLYREITLNVNSDVDIVMTLATTSGDTVIKVDGSYKTMIASFADISGNDCTDEIIADMTADDFSWAFTINGDDATSLITTLAGNNANEYKVKYGSDRSYLTQTLLVTCTCGDMVATLGLTIAAL